MDQLPERDFQRPAALENMQRRENVVELGGGDGRGGTADQHLGPLAVQLELVLGDRVAVDIVGHREAL